jgi:hypothetical protein
VAKYPAIETIPTQIFFTKSISEMIGEKGSACGYVKEN